MGGVLCGMWMEVVGMEKAVKVEWKFWWKVELTIDVVKIMEVVKRG